MMVPEGDAVTGALIRGFRKQALLSQEELADRSDLSVRTVRNIETGRVTHPHPKTIRRIMDALTASGAPFILEHEGVTVRVIITLLDKIHARAVERADNMGTTLSSLINSALEAELARHELTDHVEFSIGAGNNWERNRAADRRDATLRPQQSR